MDGVAQWRIGDPAPPPLPRRSEADVVARWQDGPPLVSVLCPTYQHVDFIEDALRGFLGQDTDFPFEIIVRDDASTDGTTEIVRDYAERYPSIVRTILEKRNTYGDVFPLVALEQQATGLFIATCEGDDYWIASDKLSRQASILHSMMGVQVVGHSYVSIHDQRIQALVSSPISARAPYRASARDLRRGQWFGLHTSAVMYRRVEWPEPLSHPGVMRDVIRNRWFGVLGEGHILPAWFASVYRRHAGGVSGSFEYGRRDRLDGLLEGVGLQVRATTAFIELGVPDAAESTSAEGIKIFLSLGVSPWRTLVGAASTLARGRLRSGFIAARWIGRVKSRLRVVSVRFGRRRVKGKSGRTVLGRHRS